MIALLHYDYLLEKAATTTMRILVILNTLSICDTLVKWHIENVFQFSVYSPLHAGKAHKKLLMHLCLG